MSTTPNLEPATARKLAGQLQLVSGDTLRALLDRATRWQAEAVRKHADLTKRADAGAHNLKRAVQSWDQALPVLDQAIAAAHARLGAAAAEAPTTVSTQAATSEATAATVEPPAPAKADQEAGGMSGLDAAVQVLRETGGPLDTPEMVKRMLERGLWSTNGKTPAATIYAAIIREIRTKGSEARFRKVARGRFETT